MLARARLVLWGLGLASALVGCGGDSTSSPGTTGASVGSGGSTDGGPTTGPSSGLDTGTASSAGASTGAADTGVDTSSGGGSTAEICEPPTEDPSAIGDMCEADGDCPPGYTCIGFQGFVFQQSCGIMCEGDCGCPGGTTCIEVSDKARTWMNCAPA